MNNNIQKTFTRVAGQVLLFSILVPSGTLLYAAEVSPQSKPSQSESQAATVQNAAAQDSTLQSSGDQNAMAQDSIIRDPAMQGTVAQTPTQDPYEGFNRVMFKFNDKIDSWILKPVATLYNKVMPGPLNQGVQNFFNNISNLTTIANDVLQFNFYQAANDMWRLGINTTVGIGGLFDIASRMQLKQYSNDFGLTLAAWGYDSSDYLVLPFFGSSTIRDGVSIPVDYFAFSIYPYIEPPSSRYELYGLGVINRRAQLLKFQSVMEEAAIDRYVFVRNAYMQRRAYQIEKNQHLSYKAQKAQEQAPESH